MKQVNLQVAVFATDRPELWQRHCEDIKKMTLFKCDTKPVLGVKITKGQMISMFAQ